MPNQLSRLFHDWWNALLSAYWITQAARQVFAPSANLRDIVVRNHNLWLRACLPPYWSEHGPGGQLQSASIYRPLSCERRRAKLRCTAAPLVERGPASALTFIF